MQPQFMAMLTIADGTSTVNETVFESRNKHVGELRKMGANIIAHDSQHSTIKGVKQLTGATVTSWDLRGGAAMILASLAAEGESTVYDEGHIERGYEKIEDSFSRIGGIISYKK